MFLQQENGLGTKKVKIFGGREYGLSDRINNCSYKRYLGQDGYKSSNNIRINSISNIDILGNRKIVNRVAKAAKMINNSKFKTNLSRNVNADNTVGQPSRANADPISDPNRINNCLYKKEWECLLKCQIESGTYSKSPFLLGSAALLNDIMLVVCKRQHILFNKFKTNISRNVNADNTVGQHSRANADPISDPSGIG
ncbi:hypothetical protein BCR32DRAFT_277093 [Anaeromyces robustus]|uniref:Uncharacterized protein n=1 Tax=Anaeromyces robustus TaxID=1754192 RepID=A0A1Y1XFF3_9FUNG|nr:hypothetical protein BCR32DRAFT_277093 [Anaeromyces robustus]|eukprot:ORX84489.1 hypothetical protein BCR32DRAFT_277093 [Anaeromyces robustus]